MRKHKKSESKEKKIFLRRSIMKLQKGINMSLKYSKHAT